MMTLAGYPVLTFVPLLVAVVLALMLVRELGVLIKALGVDPQSAEGGKQLTAALYAGELRLHDLGVHRHVWRIRLAFIGETICILLFAYLIYRAEAI